MTALTNHRKRWYNSRMTLTDRYRKALRKGAARETRKLLKRAAPEATLTKVVWGKELQDAYLDAGWHPISESPRVDLTDHLEWTEMTMTITKGK